MPGDILFNNARGDASTLQSVPPYTFSNVKMTVFPLPANLARLNQFCDGYLNQADQIVQFKPFLPFVFLIILDYGRMSAPAAKTGWLSQREVAFGIPLRWLEPDASGEMCFKDMAFTTPFIFVDNELSLSTGREVYGWPKLLARLDPRIDEWIKDPHGGRRVFEIRSRAAADHAGDDLKAPFLSVTQTPLTGLLDFPPNLKSATQAAAALPQALVSMVRSIVDAGRALGDVAIERGRNIDGLGNLFSRDMVQRVLGGDDPARLLTPKHWAQLGGELRALVPQLYSNTINLKQFRDAENPMVTCYEAITAAKMPVIRFGGGGFLGTQNLMMGQIDGGYRVNIINTATVPVVSHLGLIEAGQQEVDGGVMSSFAPVCPYWVDLDMVYDLGQTIAMRTRHGEWQKSDDQVSSPIPTPNPRRKRAAADADTSMPFLNLQTISGEPLPGRDLHLIEASNPFNTTRGASEAIGGVFRLKDARIRVLPLLADPDVLNSFVDKYIQVPEHMRVSAWGKHVYMLCSHLESITSDMLPGRTGHSREVAFVVPVKCYDWDTDPDAEITPPAGLSDGEAQTWRNGASQLIGTAIVAPFNYADDITSAITDSEVFGVPTLRSVIESPPEGWAAEEHEQGVLLTARASVAAALGIDEEETHKTLLEVRDRPMIHDADTADWRHISTEWGGRLAEDLMAKRIESGMEGREKPREKAFQWGRAMALRILGGLNGVNTLSLKQFRDATDPATACYQGVVMRGTAIEKLHSLEEIDKDLTVSITRFVTEPIAQTLGLIPKRTVVNKDGLCDEFEPLRPFEIHADLISLQGKTLFERSESDKWELINLPGGPLGWRPATEEDLDRARKDVKDGKPRPKVSVVGYDPDADRVRRLTPLLVKNDDHKKLVSSLREKTARDMQMLWRGVELGTLVDPQVLQTMDEEHIDDLHSFVRTRAEPPARESDDGKTKSKSQSQIDRAFELAGDLEFVSPATVLDAILTHGWGSCDPRYQDHAVEFCEFRLRRRALGQELAETLFPERECQDGYWPRSTESAFAASLRDAMTESSLPLQFRNFLKTATIGKKEWEAEIEEVARQTLPEWFHVSVYENQRLLDQLIKKENTNGLNKTLEALMDEAVDRIKSMIALLGVWPTHYKVQLREGIDAFFAALEAKAEEDKNLAEDVFLFGRAWRRLTRKLVDEAAPDGFDPEQKIDLDALMEVQDMKAEAPTPGWLQVRLELMAANSDATLIEIKNRAEAWEDRLKAKLRG